MSPDQTSTHAGMVLPMQGSWLVERGRSTIVTDAAGHPILQALVGEIDGGTAVANALLAAAAPDMKWMLEQLVVYCRPNGDKTDRRLGAMLFLQVEEFLRDLHRGFQTLGVEQAQHDEAASGEPTMTTMTDSRHADIG